MSFVVVLIFLIITIIMLPTTIAFDVVGSVSHLIYTYVSHLNYTYKSC